MDGFWWILWFALTVGCWFLGCGTKREVDPNPDYSRDRTLL